LRSATAVVGAKSAISVAVNDVFKSKPVSLIPVCVADPDGSGFKYANDVSVVVSNPKNTREFATAVVDPAGV